MKFFKNYLTLFINNHYDHSQKCKEWRMLIQNIPAILKVSKRHLTKIDVTNYWKIYKKCLI